MTGDVVAPADAPLAPAQAPTSLLSIRRHYWEITHGWRVPARSSDESPDITTPGRVA
jgi:hypothetical protein